MRCASRRWRGSAADIGKGAATSFAPDIVHAHDWQAALAPAYLHYDGGRRPATVMTVHNLAFQGHFGADLLATLELPPEALTIDGVEYFGGIGFLKAGLQFADRITTVSPTYAREIMTPESGMALDGLLRRRAAVVQGVVNGIDVDVWNPENDAHLPQPYSAARIDLRAANKIALQHRMDLQRRPDAPLFGVVARISSQKGLDLLLDGLPDLLEAGGQLALLGAGDPALEEAFAQAARTHAGEVGCIFDYDEGIAHLVQAGADFIVVPSRFEPCGLTQLCALRYGATPIVARVGGLADTVIDANEAALSAGVATGLQFAPPAVGQLAYALKRAVGLYADAAAMRRLRLNGMRADVSWRGPAKSYAALYQAIAGPGARRRGGRRVNSGAGAPGPLGVRLTAEGINVAVFSAHAAAIHFCLFDDSGEREIARVALQRPDGRHFPRLHRRRRRPARAMAFAPTARSRPSAGIASMSPSCWSIRTPV